MNCQTYLKNSITITIKIRGSIDEDGYQGYRTTWTQLVEGGAHEDSTHPKEDYKRSRHVSQDNIALSMRCCCKLGKLGIES
jgi:hypothetical protein